MGIGLVGCARGRRQSRRTTPAPGGPAPTVSARQVGVVPPDDYRDTYNDTSLPLGSVTAGSSMTGNIETAGDKDMFAVTLTAGKTSTCKAAKRRT